VIIDIDEHAKDLEYALTAALNRFSAENESSTPDFILAHYLIGCLAAWNVAVQQREKWYGRDVPMLGTPSTPPSGDHG